MAEDQSSSGIKTVTRRKTAVKEPAMFQVILLNDDYTTMDFVVAVLEGIFMKTPSEAVQIMLRVHNNGQGVAGIYIREIAEARIDMAHKQAASEGFPLRCIMEEVK